MKKKIISLLLAGVLQSGIVTLNNTASNVNQFKNDNYLMVNTFTCSSELETTEDIEEYAYNWAKKVYDINLKDYDIDFIITDLRDKKAGGYFTHGRFKSSKMTIQLSKFLFNLRTPEKRERILIHELTHICLYILNKGYHDGDDDFNRECVKNGGSLNEIGEAREMYSHLEGNEYYTAKVYDSQK